MEQDSSSMEKRFAYKFLKRLLKYIDSAQEFIAHLGECVTFLNTQTDALNSSVTLTLISVVNPEAMATSGKTDKSPHDQEIKFFAKVCYRATDVLLNLLLNY